MRLTSLAALSVLGLTSCVFASPSPLLEREAVTGINQNAFDNLRQNAKYASAAYQKTCNSPLGNTLVTSFSSFTTQGFVARDDSKNQIIVAFRGATKTSDVFVDLQIKLIPLQSSGLQNVGDALVHKGFLFSYNVVAGKVLDTVRAQAAAHPNYRIIVVGHSLGGATASLAAISIKSALPNKQVRLYTYGQPRVGNGAFASYVEKTLGAQNIFRAVHTFDGVPTAPSKLLGYRHFGTEYWNFANPASPDRVKKCVAGEDPSCSSIIKTTFLNPAHFLYFNQVMGANPSFCI